MIPCESCPTRFESTSDLETELAKSFGAPIPQITSVPISTKVAAEYVCVPLDKLRLN